MKHIDSQNYNTQDFVIRICLTNTMGILKPIIVTLLSLALLAFLVPSISYGNFTTLVVDSIVLTVLQKIVRPILQILFLPINIITLGLFAWVINVLILW